MIQSQINAVQPTSSAALATPMMQQYLQVKQAHPDCLLFYRMGDFYELFFEDAVTAASVLDISLTKRGKHQDADIAMCGVPWHSYEPYLHKLIKSGYKVAICEQMESPSDAKKRGYKAVVRREVVRIVTPGTLVEDGLLDAKQSNYLACLVQYAGQMALSWVDMSTGEFILSTTSRGSIGPDLARLYPTELLVSDAIIKDPHLSEVLQEYKSKLTIQVSSLFEYSKAMDKVKSVFSINALDSLGDLTKAQLIGAGALLEYLSVTQKGQLPRLALPKLVANNEFVQIDAATRRNLELYMTLSGEKRGSVLHVIDRTVTSSGGRLLRHYIASPLTCASAINQRLERVQFFVHHESLRHMLRDRLSHAPDIERALSRLSIQKGGPIDLLMIARALREGAYIAKILQEMQVNLPLGIIQELHYLGQHDGLVEDILTALQEDPGRLVRDGNFIAPGYHAGLDEFRLLSQHSKQAVNQLRDKYRALTTVNTLKINHNNVLGYYIEVTPLQQTKMVQDIFIHRQTLASGVRYTSLELKTLESNIMNAADEALKLELMLFDMLAQKIINAGESIALAAAALASLDVMTAFAELAVSNNYTCPQVDESNALYIKGGRHPVVEAMIEDTFIANDCDLSPVQRLWLLTGPNMAGKSTFLRQNALIVLLAQIGSFVPATSAYIGVIDKLFSRVGASDDLARGRSTFMVEMVETATILNQATAKSLVILDEIGRGTSTYDGLSIAWSVAEYLHNHCKCRALFATHYHELTALSSQLAAMTCYTMQVKEWEGEVLFLHQVIPGAADRSYGIHVAKLAGVPKHVIARANHILQMLEAAEFNRPATVLMGDLPLFSHVQKQEATKEEIAIDQVRSLIKSMAVDELSPKEALDVLYRLASMIENEEKETV